MEDGLDKIWRVRANKVDFEGFSKQLGVSPYLVRIMANRGLTTVEAMRHFLDADPLSLHDPAQLPDAIQAVLLLSEALNSGQKIRILGDYDIDGVCSVTILYRALCGLAREGTVDWQVPHRIEDGFGLNPKIIEKAHEDGIDLLITCDNGIAAGAEVQMARDLGITVVVTDHHEVPQDGGSLGHANAVVDPKRADNAYPFTGICGAVVAWKLMQVLYDHAEGHSTRELWPLIEFAAIATVGDVMDLMDENRTIVQLGLMRIRENHGSQYLGLQALMEACELAPEIFSSYHIGFILGPTLNAGGRLETAEKSVRLFITEDTEEAENLSEELHELNTKRKQMTEAAVQKAVEQIGTPADLTADSDRVLVVYLPDCHESVAGIVAGRIRETYYRPTFVITKAKEGLKGSGRSIPGYDMFHSMEQVGSYLTKFGGHEMAAGLSLTEENLEPFRRAINEACTLTEDLLREKVWIDIPMPASFVTASFVSELALLEPLGKGNESPTLAEKNLRILRVSRMGKERQFLRLEVISENGFRYSIPYFGDANAMQDDAIRACGEEAWNRATMGLENAIRLQIIYTPAFNTFRGETQITYRLKHYQFVKKS